MARAPSSSSSALPTRSSRLINARSTLSSGGFSLGLISNPPKRGHVKSRGDRRFKPRVRPASRRLEDVTMQNRASSYRRGRASQPSGYEQRHLSGVQKRKESIAPISRIVASANGGGSIIHSARAMLSVVAGTNAHNNVGVSKFRELCVAAGVVLHTPTGHVTFLSASLFSASGTRQVESRERARAHVSLINRQTQ